MYVFFKSWDSVIQVVVTVFVTYPTLIVLLRISGKRSLSKMNMFDFTITVALGSVFASTVISRDISVGDGLIAIAMLLTAQYLISRLSFAQSMFEDLIKSEPTLLFYEGELLQKEMKVVRVTKAEIYASIRQAGIACTDKVHAVVLETNGVLSVIGTDDNVSQPSLADIPNYESS